MYVIVNFFTESLSWILHGLLSKSQALGVVVFLQIVNNQIN